MTGPSSSATTLHSTEPGGTDGHRAGLSGGGRRGFLLAAVYTLAFSLWTWAAKELPSAYAAQPWQDDPYDVVVSLDLLALPLLLLLGAIRVAATSPTTPEAPRRALDLHTTAALATAICLATQCLEVLAVATRAHRAEWNTATLVQCLILAVATPASAALTWRHLRQRRAVVARAASRRPDCLDDLTSSLVKCHLSRAAHLLQRTARLHPRTVGAMVVGLLWSMLMLPKVFVEHYGASTFTAAGTFALLACALILTTLNRRLNLVAPQTATRNTEWLRWGGWGSVLAFSFHDSLLTTQGSAGLAVLLLTGGAIGAVLGSLATVAQHERR